MSGSGKFRHAVLGMVNSLDCMQHEFARTGKVVQGFMWHEFARTGKVVRGRNWILGLG